VHVMPGFAEYQESLERLGKHNIGKSCPHINKLDDADLGFSTRSQKSRQHT